MDANSDVKRITNTLDNLKQRHTGQYLEYIIEFCQKEYKWDQTKTEAVLEHAIEAGFVYTAPSNNKISYRIKSQGIIIQDNVKSVETQTEATTVTGDSEFYNLQNDMQEFFFLHSNKNLQYGFTSYTTYRILNYTKRTMPLGVKYYDYSVASQKTKTIYI